MTTDTSLLPVGNGAPYGAITVTNVQRGDGDNIAIFDVVIGAVVIHKVTLRRGRGQSTYINWPSYRNEHGRWVRYVAILSPALEDAVRDEIYRAVSEAIRR